MTTAFAGRHILWVVRSLALKKGILSASAINAASCAGLETHHYQKLKTNLAVTIQSLIPSLSGSRILLQDK